MIYFTEMLIVEPAFIALSGFFNDYPENSSSGA